MNGITINDKQCIFIATDEDVDCGQSDIRECYIMYKPFHIYAY